MARLTLAQIKHALRKYDDWTTSSKSLKKKVLFASFTDATEFVSSIGPIADSLNHHPDISVNYTTVTLSLCSHDEEGVTDRDIELAAAIEAALDKR